MLEFRVFSGVTNGFRSGNELLCYEKLLFSAKKTDFVVEYGGNSAKNAGSATILQYDRVPRNLAVRSKTSGRNKAMVHHPVNQ